MASSEDDRTYFARRAAEERRLAEQAIEPTSARAHARLAALYARRACSLRLDEADGAGDANAP